MFSQRIEGASRKYNVMVICICLGDRDTWIQALALLLLATRSWIAFQREKHKHSSAHSNTVGEWLRYRMEKNVSTCITDEGLYSVLMLWCTTWIPQPHLSLRPEEFILLAAGNIYSWQLPAETLNWRAPPSLRSCTCPVVASSNDWSMRRYKDSVTNLAPAPNNSARPSRPQCFHGGGWNFCVTTSQANSSLCLILFPSSPTGANTKSTPINIPRAHLSLRLYFLGNTPPTKSYSEYRKNPHKWIKKMQIIQLKWVIRHFTKENIQIFNKQEKMFKLISNQGNVHLSHSEIPLDTC